jgi:Short C-terminal domain
MMRRGIGRVGRPGLVRTVARTAVVAGTATAVVGGVSRHQQAKAQESADAAAYREQAAAPAPAPEPVYAAPASAAPSAMGEDKIKLLTDLAALKDQGILTEEEFAAQKAKILA